jgi:hypothetical protein
MNAIKHTKLTMALGAALVAGAITANAQAREADFSDFTRQARATVLAEATAQPSAEERVRHLRGSLEGARVIAGLPDAEEQREQALASIRSEQLAGLRKSASAQMAESLVGSRIVADLPSAEQHTSEALATIRDEQLRDLNQQAPRQLAISMSNVNVMRQVADADPNGQRKQNEWSMPEVKVKPLLDMSILHFSFRK